MATIEIASTILNPIGCVTVDKLISEMFVGMGNDFNEESKTYAITMALVKYARDIPRTVVANINGLGNRLQMPSEWIKGVSTVTNIEFPLYQNPVNYLKSEQYQVYISPSGEEIRLFEVEIKNTDLARITYTTAWKESDLDMNGIDAVVTWAASLLCEQFATRYAASVDSTISADGVNHSSKSQNFASRVKELRDRYFQIIGKKADSIPKPACAVGNIDATDSRGRPFFSHPKRGWYGF